jgi:integrating conjugative element protein (TIGR03757 family)
MLMLPGFCAADPVHRPIQTEVFTTTDHQVAPSSARGYGSRWPAIDLQIYRLDGIQQFEEGLSGNLPTDPESARRAALQRIAQLDEQRTATLRSAAAGLAKAMQYGLDRYPATVFDGQAVVYGLTDLDAALDHYRTWQADPRP